MFEAIDMANASEPQHMLSQEAVSALWRGEVIEAIKLVRLKQNIGLKEAKDHVDAYLRSQPALKKKMEEMQEEMWQGLLRWLFLLLACGAAVGFFMQGI